MVFICTLNEFIITVPGILILVLIMMGRNNTKINVSHHCRTQHNACRPFFFEAHHTFKATHGWARKHACFGGLQNDFSELVTPPPAPQRAPQTQQSPGGL